MQKSKQLVLWLMVVGFILLVPYQVSCLAATTSAPALYPAPLVTETGTKWGYIDAKGNFAIKPIFRQVEDFQPNGLAVVWTEDEHTGVINAQGNYVIQPKYNYIIPFAEGRVIAFSDQGGKLFDEKGKVLFETAGAIGYLNSGLAPFTPDKSRAAWGYIDKNGKIALKPTYKVAQPFEDGKALVKLNDNSFALIDTTGKVLHSYTRNDLRFYHGGFISFEKDYNVGYVAEDGTEVIGPISTNSFGFYKGLVVVDAGINAMGLMNKQGKYVIEPKYSDMFVLSNGNVVVGKWVNSELVYAIADSTGKFLTGFNYYNWGRYTNGVMPVADKDGMYFLNEKGQKVTSLPTIKGIGKIEMSGNLIRASIDDQISYLDKKGTVIWKQNDTLKLQNGFAVKRLNYRTTRYTLVHYPAVSGFKDKAVEQAVNKKLKEIALQKLTSKKITVQDGLNQYSANYSIKFYNSELLILQIQDLRSFPTESDSNIVGNGFVYINLKTGQFYGLKDLFKKDSNYLMVLRQIIEKQIAAKGADAANYKTDKLSALVTANLAFELKKDALDIYFASYDLYASDSHIPVFTITHKELMNIIDTTGGLWKAFNAKK